MTGKRVLERRLRMTLDFEVTAEELTDEALREYYRTSSNYEELISDREFWANISRQVRLQKVLLEDEEVLKKYLTYVVAVEVDSSSDSRLAEVFGVGGERPEEDIFGPLFSRLEEEDESFFREVSEENSLFDHMEVLSRGVKVNWLGGVLEEVSQVAEAVMEEVESDKLIE